MTAKTRQQDVVVVELPKFGGMVLNAKPSDLAEGKAYTVPFAAAMKAAKATGIANYVGRLEKSARIGLKPNNKVLAPAIRALYTPVAQEQPKAAKPGTEVNAMQNPKGSRKERRAAASQQTSKGNPPKGSKAAVRAARKNQPSAEAAQVELVIEDAPKVQNVRSVDDLNKHEVRVFNNLIGMGELDEARKMLGY